MKFSELPPLSLFRMHGRNYIKCAGIVRFPNATYNATSPTYRGSYIALVGDNAQVEPVQSPNFCRECEREITSGEFCSEMCATAFYRHEANQHRDEKGRWNCA